MLLNDEYCFHKMLQSAVDGGDWRRRENEIYLPKQSNSNKVNVIQKNWVC